MLLTIARPLRTAAPLRAALPWRSVLSQALGLWLMTRLLDVTLTAAFTSGSAAQRLARWYFWDAGFYVGIAQRGYLAADPRLAGFLPLYPLLVHLFAPSAQHAGVFLPALIVSQMALLGALVAVGLLAAQEGYAPELPMLLLAASPLGVFLTGMYSDGLFLLLAAAALLAARRGAWGWAALALALAVLTRPFGLALIPALLLEGLRQRAGWRALAALLITPTASLCAFLLMLWRQYGSPLAYVAAQDQAFGHAFRWPWQTAILAAQQLSPHALIDVAPLLLCLLTVSLSVRRWPRSFTLYTALGLLLILMSPTMHAAGQYALVSAGRYSLAFVPVLLQCGSWLQRWPRWLLAALLSLSLLLQGVLTVFVLRGGWLV